MTFAMIALLLASTNTAATANQAPQPDGGAGAAVIEKAKEEKKICKKPDTTGSRVPGGKKICMTAEQWRKAADSF